MTDLKPCPFCGDDDEKGRQAVTQMPDGNTFDRIKCRCCGAMCPEQNWNQRAASPADQAPNLSDACEALRTAFLIGNPLAIGMVRGLASLARSPRVESYHERKGATNSMSATPPAA